MGWLVLDLHSSEEATQDLAKLPVASTVPNMCETEGNNAFFHYFLSSVMTRNDYDMLTKFLKFTPSVFPRSKTENAYEFAFGLL